MDVDKSKFYVVPWLKKYIIWDGDYQHTLWQDGCLHSNINLNSHNEGCWDTKEEADAFLKQWQIDWITPEYVRQEAAKGDKEALDCSILHWQQIVDAGYRAFSIAFALGRVRSNSIYCALCSRNDLYRGCASCPLESCRAGSLWFKVENARCNEDAAAFESAAAALLAKLKKERGEKYVSKEEREQQYKDSFAIQASGAPGSYFIGTMDSSQRFLWPNGMVHGTLVANDWAAYWTSRRAAEAFLLKWRGKPVTPKHGDIVLNIEGERRLIVCADGRLVAVAENGVVWAGPGYYWSVEGSYESTERPYTVVGNIFEGDTWAG